MNHVPPFTAIDDIVKDGEGHKVCMCWGRNGNPFGGNQEAEKIAILLNQFGNRNIEVLKKMDADGISVFQLIGEFMADTNVLEIYRELKEKKISEPWIESIKESNRRVHELRTLILKYGS